MSFVLGQPVSPLRLAVLISGGGTTLRNLIQRIAAKKLDAKIELVISSSATAKGLEFAREAGIPTLVIPQDRSKSPEDFRQTTFEPCRQTGVHIVAMAGYLKLVAIPPDFTNRVTNIHPALIPACCGPGMYGVRVHEAVLEGGA